MDIVYRYMLISLTTVQKGYDVEFTVSIIPGRVEIYADFSLKILGAI